MPVYAWKIFLENAIEMVSIIPSNRASEAQTFRNHRHLASSHRTQWKHLVFISERVSCIHLWRTRFSVVPIHRTVHHKTESWTDGNSLSRKIQVCSCVKCQRVNGNFSLMLSIHPILFGLLHSSGEIAWQDCNSVDCLFNINATYQNLKPRNNCVGACHTGSLWVFVLKILGT